MQYCRISLGDIVLVFVHSTLESHVVWHHVHLMFCISSLGRRLCMFFCPDMILVSSSHSPWPLLPQRCVDFSFRLLRSLQCVPKCELLPNPFLWEICCESIEEVFFSFAWPKASNMLIDFFFDSVFELLEVWEHFVLLAHWRKIQVCLE